MAEQQQQKTYDFVMDELFSDTGLDVELSEERLNQIKMLNDATEKLQWQKRFEESEAKVAALEKEMRKIIERNGVLEGKIRSVRVLMQGHLKDFYLTSETEGLFKNIFGVLDIDPNECTCNCHSAQPTLTSTSSKINPQGQTRKPSIKSSVSKTPSEIGEPRTAPQIEIARAPLLNSTSGLQSTMNTRNVEKSKSSSAVEQLSGTTRDKIITETIPHAQSGTLHLLKNGNEDSNLPQIQLAVQSFSKSLLKNVDDDSKFIIEKICLRLNCDPVALKLAACYINEDLLALPDPLKDVIENYFKIDNAPVGDGRKVAQNVKNSSYLALRATCEKIRETPVIGEKALKFMEIISFVAADNIPTQFVLDLYDFTEKEDNSETTELLQLLERYSIINFGSGESISVHPLIQEAIRMHLEELEEFIEILGKIQSGTHEMIQEYDVTSQEMIHIQSIWEHVMKRTELIKEDGGFPSSICGELEKLGKYKEMYDFSCQALSCLEIILGENNRSTLNLKWWKGVALDYLEEYSTSLEVLTEVYEKQKELFGAEDEDCLSTANWIGGVHLSLKKYDEALECFRNALEKRERIFGVEHPETLSLKNSIAVVLNGQGKYKEALELYQQVLEIEERVKGKECPETLTTKFKISTVRCSQGKFEETLKILREVVEAQERVLVLDHPDTLTTKDWIADTYGRLGRNEEAVELYQETLEKREDILGPEHPETLTTKFNMGIVRSKQGKYEDALKLFQEVLEVQERVLEVNLPFTLLTNKKRIADTYRRLGRKEEAVELYMEVLEKREEILGPEHPQTLATKSRVATVKFSQRKYEDALKIFQEVVQVREKILEVDHPDTLKTKKWIANTYKCLGRN